MKKLKPNAVFRYNKLAQEQLKSKVHFEPFLHFAFVEIKPKLYYYQIWVWDTREIVDSGTAKINNMAFAYANDSKEPLKGSGNKFEL